MNDHHDLSRLSREELMELVAAQQSQLLTNHHQPHYAHHQQQQQQQQQQHAALSWLSQQQQLQNASASNPFLQDRLMGAHGTLGGANGTRKSSSSGTHTSGFGSLFPNAGGAAAGMANNSAVMADFMLRNRQAQLESNSSAAGTVSQSGGALDVLRARLANPMAGASASAAGPDLSDPLLRNLLLQQMLAGKGGVGMGGGGSQFGAGLPSFLGGRSAAEDAAAAGMQFPSARSNEDAILRSFIAKQHASAAAAAAGGDLWAVEREQQRSFLEAQQHSFRDTTAAAAMALGATNHPSLGRGAVASDHVPTAGAVEENRNVAAAPVEATARMVPAAKQKKAKRPLSAYNIFFKEEHAKIIAQNEKDKAAKRARGEVVSSDDEYEDDPDAPEGQPRKRKRTLSTNQPGKRGKRQVDFENLTKVIGKRWKELPKERVDDYKRQAEEAMQAYRRSLFQKIRQSVKDDQSS